MFKDKKVAILGFGLEGKDLLSFLLKEGAEITIFDKKEEDKLDLEGIPLSKINLVLGRNYLRGGLTGFDTVFRSPGVYRYLPQIVEAEKKGVKISSAVKLFFELCPSTIIGVTGTKGKGTTASIISEILKEAGKDVYLAGNIGKPYLELLGKLKKKSIVVLELSSFQLMDMEVSPHIAVVLNITQDHMDWHKDLKEYVDAKKNIVKFQKKKDFAVINYDYDVSKDFAKGVKGKVIFFSRKEPVNGCFSLGEEILLSTKEGNVVLGKTHWLLLRGEHNLENVTAAVSAVIPFSLDEEIIKKVVFSFKGLEHRLELVGRVGGVAFYNDSFATSPAPAIAAINSFKEPITIILGGSEKNLDYKEFGEVVSKKKNVTTAILIGKVAEKIEKALKDADFKGKILDLDKSSMEKIVAQAFEATPKGGVVLLSPAAASFDMFKDYKERGNKFKNAVELVLRQAKS